MAGDFESESPCPLYDGLLFELRMAANSRRDTRSMLPIAAEFDAMDLFACVTFWMTRNAVLMAAQSQI
jgi:hypothetical protein